MIFLEPVNGADEYISCTIWENESDIKAFESSPGYSQVFGKIKDLALQAPHQKYYNA